MTIVGVSNGPIQFKSARKNWPLPGAHQRAPAFARIARKNYTGARLLVLAKFLQLLACSHSR